MHAPDHSTAESLASSEALVIISIRAWAELRGKRQDPRAMLDPALEQAAGRFTCEFFGQFMGQLERGLQRALNVRCGGCLLVTRDERRVLTACSLAVDQPELAAAVLAPLVRDAPALVTSAAMLAAALSIEGQPLPPRAWDEEWTAGPAPKRTVH